MEAIEKAIQYVRDNRTWSNKEESVALDIMSELRCDLGTASDKIVCEIHDLMEEWSEEHDYPEGWWRELLDEEEIFMKL